MGELESSTDLLSVGLHDEEEDEEEREPPERVAICFA